MAIQLEKGERRTPAQLREHYEIERELAARLQRASREERRQLYARVYDELFQRVPLHGQLTRKASPEEGRRRVEAQMAFLQRFLRRDATFLEVGAGDCGLTFAAAARVQQAVAIEVSAEITRAEGAPPNFRLILSDGVSVPVPEGSVDVAYSNQLMEHLHPDDAFEQLRNICRALRPGGCYICITPNRLSGPHDISRYFDAVATGFHLKEYTTTELCALFRRAGFSRLACYIVVRGLHLRPPVALVRACESLLARLPGSLGRRLARRFPCRRLLDVRLVGVR